jgi:transposase
MQCAWAAARKKASYLQAQFHRLRSRRGAKKAIGALAASILTIVYHMLIDGTVYHDLGPDHFDRRAKAAQTSRLVTPCEISATISKSPPCPHDRRLSLSMTPQ